MDSTKEPRNTVPELPAELSPIERAEQLIWDMFEESISESQVIELQNIYRDHPSVCDLYIKCRRIHLALEGPAAKRSNLDFPDWLNAPLSAWRA